MTAPTTVEAAAHDEKRYLAGTHRARTPEQTLAVVAPLLSAYGITRVADVTGLDRIGIPVFMAIRPNSRSLAVSQGKGLDRAAAKASAVMEAVELYQAERISSPVRLQSHADLVGQVQVADPATLPLIRDSAFTPHRPIPWIEGRELATGEPIWVPFELVHTDATVPPVPGSGCFDRGTNGLASGNTLSEAVLHGLCEVIERDAIALWRQGGERRRDGRRVDLDTVRAEPVVDLLDRFAAAQVDCVVWDMVTDIGLPAYQALIVDRTADPVLNPAGSAFGAGCHLDSVVAMTRALTEAAQSRLTAIAGSRDDLKATYYGPRQAQSALDYGARMAAAPPIRAMSRVSLATPTFRADLACVLGRLRSVGLDTVIVVDLSPPGGGIHVVRVIVPGLEGPTESPMYRPGSRARAIVAED